jgi:hypothetical protein
MSSSSQIDTQFSGISSTSNYPPHNGLAVGPGYIVMAEGSRIEWTNLTGGAASLQSVYSFFGSLGTTATNSLYDPRCIYDSASGRFIVIMENLGSNGAVSNINIAVSKDSNPNDGWYFASLNTALTINGQATASDRATISVDANNIYISAPQYNNTGGDWQGTESWVIGKTAGAGGGLYNGGTMTVVANQVSSPNQGIFAVTAGNNGKTYYACDYSTGGQIVLALQTYDTATSTFGPVTTISLGNIDQGGSYTAQQLGTTLLLDAGDKRVQNLVYSNGFLYGVAEEKPIGSSVPLVHWFKMDVSNPNSPTLVAQGDISGASLGTNVATFNGSIAVSAAGDVIINFTASGPNLYPSDYYVLQSATDPVGSFSAPILYQASSGFFNSGNGSTTQRWGAYSTAIADLSNPHAFWISNEYVANNWWQTSVAQVEVKSGGSATVASIATSGAGISGGNGNLNAGKLVTLTVNFGSAVTVNTAAGPPTLALNDGGSATYTGGSGTTALTFSYTVAAGQNTADLVVSSLNLNGATIRDGAGNAADLSGATNYNPAGLLNIDTTTPAAPTGLTLDPSTDSGTVGDGVTNFSQVKIDGTAEPGSTVTLYDTNGTSVLGTGTANATTGAFSITTSTLSSGNHTITAKATDAAGNVSSASAGYALTETPATSVYNHIVVVVEENRSYSDIIGSSAAPYINSLANQGVSFTDFHAEAHPSQPNYLALFSGSTQGVTDDNSVFFPTTPTLAGELLHAGYSFTGYAEAPKTGYHDPWEQFGESQNLGMDFSQFPTDFNQLPTVSFVIPNVQDDMHNGTIAQGDQWLSTNLSAYANWAMTHNSLLVVTWDENDGSTGNQIPTIIVGDGIPAGQNSQTVNHYDLLHTIENAYGLPGLTSNDINASLLNLGSAPPPPSSSEIDTLFSGISDTSDYPPHNALAVGPNNIVMLEGSRIEWTNLTGGSPTLQSKYQFFGSLGSAATNALYDPRAVYDPINQRYIVTMGNLGPGGATSNIDIAVSKTSNPNDGWNFASLNTFLTINGQATVSDVPVVSVDGTNIYITAPQDNVSGGGWQGTGVWVIGDTAGSGGGIYNGGALTVVANEVTSPNQGMYRVVAGNNGKSYYASSYSNGSNQVVTVQVYDVASRTFGPVSTISLGNIDQGGSYTAQQKGTSLLLDAVDKRVQNLAYSNGFLYGVMEEKPIGSAVPLVHWVKIDVSNPNSPTLVAQGDISGTSIGSNVATFNASIAVNAAGDVLINFTASGPNTYPSDYYVFHAANDNSNAFSAPVLYQASSGSFDSGNGSSTQRWGINSTTIADPANPHSFWVSNEYIANGWWQTVAAQVEIKPSPETPTLSLSNTALTVPAGGSASLGVHVTPFDANDTVSVTISGLTSYETITDGLDQSVFSGSSVTVSAAQMNSGLTLHSSYTGSDHPVNTLTLTASNTTPGEAATTPAQTIVVTDPPAQTTDLKTTVLNESKNNLAADPIDPTLGLKALGYLPPSGLNLAADPMLGLKAGYLPSSGLENSPYANLASLLDQYMAAAKTSQGPLGLVPAPWMTSSSQAWLGEPSVLARPKG